MLERISSGDFCYKNIEYNSGLFGEIAFYFGRYPQNTDDVVIDGNKHLIFRREKFTFPGIVGDPLNSLLKNCLNIKTVRRIKSFHPDVVLYRFFGCETLVDTDQPNPEGVFMLKFEMALAAKE